MEDVLGFISFEIAVISTAVVVAGAIWRMRNSVEQGRLDASAEHALLMRKLEESIEQDRRNDSAIVDQISKMDERNADAHSKFLETLAHLDERTKGD